MVYLVTGGTGIVGSFLVELISNDDSVDNGDCRVIVRSPEKKVYIEKLGLSPILADLNDKKSLKIALKDVEVVFNLAAKASDTIGWDELYRVNVLGMKNLIEECLSANSDPFLSHASSTGVYGHFIPSKPIDENFRFDPTSIYQKSKYFQEKVLWEVYGEEGWDNFGVIRPPSVIGPRDTKTILPIFKAIWEQKFPILKNGQGYSTFIHPHDFSSALLLLYKKRNQTKGQAYNLKSFECLLFDFLKCITDKINPPIPPKRMNYQLVYTIAVLSEVYTKITGHQTTLNRYRVTKFANSRRFNDQKIKKIGFKAEKDMKTTIDESLEWCTKNNYYPFTNLQ
ncbi:MAG: NAD-dependent epimerase/dehydratase family protein [Candidatus Hodarchaeota archaeon]